MSDQDTQTPPNSSEEEKVEGQKAVGTDPTVINIERKPMDLLMGLVDFIRNIFTLQEQSIIYSKVITETKEGISVQGYNVWILMCSIAIASVGLNVNSTAVIIGAMLISPLMGPIRGIGFGIGINDFTLLIRSIKNLGVTVVVSLAVSFLYFFISPIDTVTDQLFIRTEPTFLDVLIAFFGGLAGVIAAVNSKNDTVIPGVAIATALMPPLCTAGYGLAIGNIQFFVGAMYLFIINSVLIALSTLIVVRYLNFPKREYLDAAVEKKVRNYIVIFMLIIILPSGYMFYRMTLRTIFESNATEFVQKVVVPNTEGKVTHFLGYSPDSSFIDVEIQGDIIDGKTIALWKKQKNDFNLNENVSINIYQDGDYKAFIDERLKDVMANSAGSKELIKLIRDKDDRIEVLLDKIDNLNTNKIDQLPLNIVELIQDFKIDYPECDQITVNRAFTSNARGSIDTLYTLDVKFNSKINDKNKGLIKNKLENKFKLKLMQRQIFNQDSLPVFSN